MKRSWIARSSLGLTLGVVMLGACVGAMPEGGAAPGADPRASADGAADGGPDGGCPHGSLEDPHHGFVRCLEPHEKGADWLPPASQPDAPADAGPDAAPPPSSPSADAGPPDSGTVVAAPAPEPTPAPAPPGPPPIVEVKPPSFMSGDVPKIDQKLEKLSDKIAQCVADNGGLTAATGTLKVQFLVRVRGRAEGVEVVSSKGISDQAAECVRLLLKNRAVGTPSDDPVGVTVTFALKKGPESAPRR